MNVLLDTHVWVWWLTSDSRLPTRERQALDEAAAQVLADKTLDVHEHGDHFHFSLEDQSE